MMKEMKIKVNDNLSLLVSLPEEASLNTFAGITTYINALRRVDTRIEEVSKEISRGRKLKRGLPKNVREFFFKNVKPKTSFKDLKAMEGYPKDYPDSRAAAYLYYVKKKLKEMRA